MKNTDTKTTACPHNSMVEILNKEATPPFFSSARVSLVGYVSPSYFAGKDIGHACKLKSVNIVTCPTL